MMIDVGILVHVPVIAIPVTLPLSRVTEPGVHPTAPTRVTSGVFIYPEPSSLIVTFTTPAVLTIFPLAGEVGGSIVMVGFLVHDPVNSIVLILPFSMDVFPVSPTTPQSPPVICIFGGKVYPDHPTIFVAVITPSVLPGVDFTNVAVAATLFTV
jgi:hypothetical protein